MAFGDYENLGAVALEYQVSVRIQAFVQPIPFLVDAVFLENLTFTLQNINVRMSEAAIGEFVIAPVLREAWKPHSDALQFWSHVPFGNGALQGVPDYYFSRRSPLGLINDQPPYVLVVEAKKDDFDGGWGQCLAAMLAAQQLNGQPPRVIHGAVSNGAVWEFGRLAERQFTREIRSYGLADLPVLFAVWNYIFSQAREQALLPAA
jgi:hypothetical protein